MVCLSECCGGSKICDVNRARSYSMESVVSNIGSYGYDGLNTRVSKYNLHSPASRKSVTSKNNEFTTIEEINAA